MSGRRRRERREPIELVHEQWDPDHTDPTTDAYLPAGADDDTGWYYGEQDAPPRRRRGLLLTMLVVGALVLAVVVGGGYALTRALRGSDDYAGAGTGAVTVQVASGDTAADIAATLQDDGVVKSTGAFTSAASANPDSRLIQPGYYALRLQMKASLALDALLDKKNLVATKVVVPEGFTASQVLARIAAHTKITLPELQAAVNHPDQIGLPSYAGGRVEGFLFPATYDIGPDRTAVQALAQLTSAFGQAADSVGLVAGAGTVGLTPLQVVTAASLVQAEVKPPDFAKVAEVIVNRLHDHHALGLETAERYAAGIDGNTPLTQALIAKAETTGYATYHRLGLPIGPIDNPGQAALEAVLHPATGNLYFYVTDPKTGATDFFDRDDYAGFQRAAAACQNAGGCR